ncbi:hypothetical protein FHL15_004190 [Xylaria flabelliformis]|uniref:Uncharacterized protein n=1 Tax=Xylaria flabelliformis TaxID=2512241 RepID=A0A553I4G6_9PEZI|nr:hypothetical protein FHL15_004190 [Xylaria flabelliformis]
MSTEVLRLNIIDIFEKLFLNKTSPADAAYSINDELYPFMKANPADLCITLVWGIMLDAMREIETKGEDGNSIRKDWDLEPDESLTDSEWLAQKTHFHNATSFAATALAASPPFFGFIFFFLVCMGNAFGLVDNELASPVRAARVADVADFVPHVARHAVDILRMEGQQMHPS